VAGDGASNLPSVNAFVDQVHGAVAVAVAVYVHVYV
jgi:hypothetical protein